MENAKRLVGRKLSRRAGLPLPAGVDPEISNLPHTQILNLTAFMRLPQPFPQSGRAGYAVARRVWWCSRSPRRTLTTFDTPGSCMVTP